MLLREFNMRYWDFDDKKFLKGKPLETAISDADFGYLLKYGEFNVATGILAADGTMVYEGDLVTADIPVGPAANMYYTFEFVVEFNDGKFNVDSYCHGIEIIGNKYEGPYE